MPRKKLSPKLSVIISGFIGGVISGIAIRTGVSINSVTEFLWNGTCLITQSFLPFKCYALLGLITLLIALLGFILVIYKVMKIRSITLLKTQIPGWLIGLVIYSLFYAIGVSLIVSWI